MNVFLKILFSIILLCGLVVSFTHPASAFDPLKACNAGSTPSSASVCNNSPTENPIAGKNGIVTKAIQILAVITGVAAIIIIMYAGLRFILSGGDPAKVTTARSTVLYAVVGLVIAALAQAIVVFVLSRL